MGHARILWWLGEHLAIATALAAVVLIVCRVFRLSPAARHVLWLLVLCRLIAPSVGVWPWAIPAGFPPANPSRTGARVAVVTDIPGPDLTSPGSREQEAVDSVRTGSESLTPRIQEHESPDGPGFLAAAPTTTDRGLFRQLPTLLVLFWGIGSVTASTLVIRRIRRVSRLLTAESGRDEWLEGDVARWCRRLEVRSPDCVVTGRFRSPFLWCLGRVRLVWPARLAAPEQREPAGPIIVHELAHLKRRDHWTAWIELAALAIWWWNPLFWFVRRQLRTSSEMACDAWVVELLPDQRRAYAESLVEFSSRMPMGQFALGALGADPGSRRAFQQRLEMIMNGQNSARYSTGTILLAVLLGVLSLPAYSVEPETQVTGPNPTSPSPAVGTTSDDADGLPIVQVTASDAVNDEQSESTISLNEVLEQIADNYYGPVDRNELERAAIEAVISRLDPDSQLLSRDQLDDVMVNVEGQLAGVGVAIEIDDETKLPTVTRPIRHSPAHAAGIRPGDVIVSIDGESTQDLDLRELLERIRGPRGSAVTLRIRTADETRDVEVTRDRLPVLGIEPWSVSADDQELYRIGADGPGYVHIPAFTRQTAPQLRQVLADLNAAGVTGLVLDLRNCGGGLLTAATDVADMFLDEGVIVSSRGRTEDQTTTIRATGDGTFTNLRLAVLVNGHTASAAEILAASLQDHHRAAIIGEQTFGRGTVQSLFTLNDGSALKLTTAAWLRPNGKSLQRSDGNDDWGVRPDSGYAVPLTDDVRARLDEAYQQRLNGEPVNPDDDPQLTVALAWLEE